MLKLKEKVLLGNNEYEIVAIMNYKGKVMYGILFNDVIHYYEDNQLSKIS